MNRVPWNQRCAVMGCGMVGTEPYLGLKWCLTHLYQARETHTQLRLYAPVMFTMVFLMLGVWLLPYYPIVSSTFLTFALSVMVIDRVGKRRARKLRRDKVHEPPTRTPPEGRGGDIVRDGSNVESVQTSDETVRVSKREALR